MRKPTVNMRVSKEFEDFTKKFAEKNQVSMSDATRLFRKQLLNDNKIKTEFDLW